MEIAIVSDTHVPSRASRIPDEVRDRIASADHVIHAGDFDSKGAVADVRDLAPELTAVAGNMDPAVGLPSVASVDLGGVTFVVTHGTGPDRGYEGRVTDAVRQRDGDVGVSGHTHEVMDVERDGLRLLNPGSATGAAPARRTTMMTATVEDGDLAVELHEL
ncbi:metallophosphoesterase family protein [Halomicrobium salinisoli]|uniref:metallophosphoesterase family protein n=1 Tax=Halomicrobium salinisoli TaxID=2878391 RepID=UPI001CF0CC3E|nr:metallophosphoesterase family protein [Halomicrobium salinisoli]